MRTLYPIMAMTGILLAAYGMLVTPDEIQGGQELAQFSHDPMAASVVLPGSYPHSSQSLIAMAAGDAAEGAAADGKGAAAAAR
jgi:hypothetical protein